MKFINNLDNNSILIVPGNLKNKILNYINDNALLKSIKIMSFNDLKRGLFFSYDAKTINYVMNKLNISYGIAFNYVENLYYIDNSLNNSKMDFLIELKKDLENNGLLYKDSLFKDFIKSKAKLYVYGSFYMNKFNKYLLSLLSNDINVEIIEKEDNNYKHVIHEFDSNFDEVAFVLEQISQLLDNGVSCDKIYIANYSDEYSFAFKMLAKQYKLPIYIKSSTSLFATSIGNYFYNNLDSNLYALLKKIKKLFRYDDNLNNRIVIDRLANLLNSYYWCDDITTIKELLLEDMKKVMIPSNHFTNEIVTTSILDNQFDLDEYVFLIGFNLGVIPKMKKDEDFISDAIKPDFLEKTDEYNLALKNKYIKEIRSIKNLTITYKRGTPFLAMEKSFLCDDIGEIVKEGPFVSNYSNNYNKTYLTKCIDALKTFNELDENLSVLYHNYPTVYKTYDNSFTGVNKKGLLNLIDDKIVFSYSNIVDYYKCPFKFYIKHILKINKFETSLSQFIGSVYHYVLQKSLNSDLDYTVFYDEYVNSHLDDLKRTNKNNYFIETLKKELGFVIATIKHQETFSSHQEAWFEKEIILDVAKAIKTKIKGFVDKVLVFNNYLLVIDYKTSETETIEADLFEFGLSIQLPIYLYLLKCLDDNYEVAGIYIQHILNSDILYAPNCDIEEEKKKKLKLCGITFDNIDAISKFDSSYEDSEVIKSLRVKDGELRKYKSVFSLEKREQLIELAQKLIDDVIDNVSDGLFDIHPIKIDKTDGCSYCEYRDICFRKFKDFNIKYKTIRGEEDE